MKISNPYLSVDPGTQDNLVGGVRFHDFNMITRIFGDDNIPIGLGLDKLNFGS